MPDAAPLFALLRTVADPRIADAIEALVTSGSDRALCRVNAPAFAAANALDEEATVAAFLHAASIGLFDLSWNILCPGCGGVLDTNASLKSVVRDEYVCALCATGYTPTLDELVEVTFTVSPRVRRIAAHDPHHLPLKDYLQQIYWGSGVDVADDQFDALMDAIVVDSLANAANEAGDLLHAGVDWSHVSELAQVAPQAAQREETQRTAELFAEGTTAPPPDATEGPVLLKTVGDARWDLAAAELAWSQVH